MCECVCMYVHVYMHVPVCERVCACMGICACVCTYMHACVYVCSHAHVWCVHVSRGHPVCGSPPNPLETGSLTDLGAKFAVLNAGAICILTIMPALFHGLGNLNLDSLAYRLSYLLGLFLSLVLMQGAREQPSGVWAPLSQSL